MQLIDLIGRRFSRLTVTSRSSINSSDNHPVWWCACDCGKRTQVKGDDLRSGKTKSCGCLRKETAAINGRKSSTTHGHAKRNGISREWFSWRSMKQRCTDPNATGYNRYGALGITICKRWFESFENFLADMGPRPAGHSLDRYPNPHGNYKPSNCRWATRHQQAQNRRWRKCPV